MKLSLLGSCAFLLASLGLAHAKLYFTADDLVAWPRPSKITLSPKKTHGLYFTTAYDAQNRNTTVKAYVIKFGIGEDSSPETHEISELFSKLGSILKSPPSLLWLDQVTLAFVFDNQLWSLEMPKDLGDISRYPSLVRPPSNISPLKGLEDVDNLKFHPESGTLIFSAKVVRHNYRKDFGDSALVFDQLFARHWDTFVDPEAKRQLFNARIKRGKGSNHNWFLSSDPLNLLQGTELVISFI